MTVPAADAISHGAFVPSEGRSGALTRLHVEFLAVDAIAEWTRCSTLADFAAQYMSPDFGDRTNAALVLSTVLNELVENGAKFSYRPEDTVTMTVLHLGETLRIDVRNSSDAQNARALLAWLEEMDANDVDALFLRRLADPPGGVGRGSRIGLLILKKDYGARIAARIVPENGGDSYAVEVQVTLSTEDLER